MCGWQTAGINTSLILKDPEDLCRLLSSRPSQRCKMASDPAIHFFPVEKE